MMAKRAFLIHRWEGYPEEGWRPWLKKELEGGGFEVIIISTGSATPPSADKICERIDL